METKLTYITNLAYVGFDPTYKGWKLLQLFGVPPAIVGALILPTRDGNIIFFFSTNATALL